MWSRSHTSPLGDVSIAAAIEAFTETKWNKPLSARLQPIYGKKAVAS
jgi:hypothetical protein